jgi:hypothetical protein
VDQDSRDGQDRAEALDDSKVDTEFPPEEPLGVDKPGVTAIEEQADETFAERTDRAVVEDPEVTAPVVQPYHDAQEDVVDDEAELVAEAEVDGRDPEADGVPEPAEEAALRLRRD